MKKILNHFLLIFALSSCFGSKNNFPNGEFPEEVQNFELLNTPHDEMNMDSDVLYHSVAFTFSTNQTSAGGQFDLEVSTLDIIWDTETGSLSFSVSEGENNRKNAISKASNSSCDERGPYSFYDESGDLVMLYSGRCDEETEIKLVREITEGSNSTFSEPQSIHFLPESHAEMYPSLMGGDFQKSLKIEEGRSPKNIVFSADMGDGYDIYQIEIPDGISILEFLRSEEFPEASKLNLNSDFNDHFPFVYKNILLFASDRSGGLGGYDLYYSIFQNGTWTDPVNLGDQINSAQDEYRPILESFVDYKNDMLIFSSNRPGGKGGFDIYYVGYSFP
ncbi:hypothetical protein PBT90_11285 [Algoriphagus halophytocola]|uniref:WD40 repeat protein n=1 Tax=Algoriphagus halophytocola TaxID=2991499 RepID=A0ABY6MNR7_9BACT|nr:MULTISPECIES: hypothetical protein [unclassified Algoriphagus]UZD23966.1 hypothetical protein OM944_05595 [Algoriphagus sp. TR-M5]WBL41338.1 hypothetical protein PBT90_11285 [Algoriphagus sp. TR-M9]